MSGFSGVLLSDLNGNVIPLTTLQPADAQTSPTGASCSITFAVNGAISYTGNTSFGQAAWFNQPFVGGAPGPHWIKLDVNSGSTPAGDLTSTVLSLSTPRTWSLTRNSLGTSNSSCTISIYNDAGGTTLVASGTCTFQASESSP